MFGYDTGVISGALLQISKEFHTGSGMEQVIAASILLGAVIGALLMRRLSLDKRMKVLNRLGFVLAVAVVALGAAVWIAVAALVAQARRENAAKANG